MEILKKRNRTLLEVNTGVILLAVLVVLIGAVCPVEKLGLTRKDWIAAIATAAFLDIFSYLHIYRCLDRALDFDEGTASKTVVRGYLTRYMILAVVLIGSAVTGLLDPLVLCLGYLLMMKASAYMQPYTHKFYNFVFHEADPVPEPLDEEKKESLDIEK